MSRHALFLVLSIADLLLASCTDDAVDGPDDEGEAGTEASATTGYETWPEVVTTTEGAPAVDGTTGELTGGEVFAVCAPGEVEVCAYGGPTGTLGVGACRAGERICGGDGAWMPCRGEVQPRAEDCRTRKDEGCDGSGGCDGGVVWARGFGEEAGGEPGSQYPHGLTVDGEGRAWIAGRFSKSVQFGEQIWRAEGYGSFMMAEIDGDGVPGYSFGDEQEGAFGHGRAVASDGEGLLAVGAMHQGRLRIHLDSANYKTNESTPSGVVGVVTTAGEYVWSHFLRPEYDAYVSIRDTAFDGSGNLWVGGSDNGDFTVGSLVNPVVVENHGGADGFLLKMTPEGEVAWYDGFGDDDHQYIHGIAVDSTGNVWLTGGFEGKMEFDGGVLNAPADTRAMFVVKLDANGAWQWGRSYGADHSQSFYDIAIAPDGSAVLAGSFSGTIYNLGAGTFVHEGPDYSPIVAKFAPDGEALWARDWACEGYCEAERLAVDGAGQSVVVLSYGWGDTIVVDGQAFVGAPDEWNAIVVKLDREGETVWASERMPDTPHVAVGPVGEVFVAGEFKTHASLAGGAFQLDAGVGDSDLYVLKMRP